MSIHRLTRVLMTIITVQFFGIGGSSAWAQSSTDGVVWTRLNTGIANQNFYALAARDDKHVAVGGTGNTLLLFDGAIWDDYPGWSTFSAISWSGSSVWGAVFDSHGNLHVVGESGAYAYHDASGWHAVTIPDSPFLRSIWIDPTTDRVLTGKKATDGIVCITPDGTGGYAYEGVFTTGYSGGDLMGIAGTGLHNIWTTISGTAYGMRRSFDGGTNWTAQIAKANILAGNRALHVLSDTFAVFGGNEITTGDGNYVGFWDSNLPNTIQPFSTQPDFYVRSIYAHSKNAIWVSGAGGSLAYYDGTTWHTIDLDTDMSLSLMAVSETRLWLSGGAVGTDRGLVFMGQQPVGTLVIVR